MRSKTGIATTKLTITKLTLDKLGLGAHATVAAVTAKNRELRHRLLSLGVVEGTHLEVTHFAPFGGPMNIRIRDTVLSLRRSEAEQVLVAA